MFFSKPDSGKGSSGRSSSKSSSSDRRSSSDSKSSKSDNQGRSWLDDLFDYDTFDDED